MPPPPPTSYQYQPVPAFPSPGACLSAGWKFCAANFWIVALLAGVAAIANVVSGLPGYASDSPNGVLVGLLSLVSALVSVLLVLGLLRRAFDYWDETTGRAQPRQFGDAIATALSGATPRLLPWIGWNFVLALIIALFLVPVVIVIAATNSSELALIVGLLALVGFFLASVYLAFVPAAIADRPGNPFSASIDVVRGHFWTILGTFLLLAIIAFVAFIPLVLVIAVLGDSTFGDVLTTVYVLILTTVIEAVGLGAIVAMYRSVIQP